MVQLIIPDEATSQTYTVTSAQSVFPFTFAVFTKADLHFKVGSTELLQSDFTLTGTLLDGGGYQGGTITLNTPVSGVTCQVWRETLTARTTNFTPAGQVPVRDMDVALNRLVAMAQDQRRDIISAGGGAGVSGVASVNTRTGSVNLTASDVTSGFGALMATNLVAGSGVTLTTVSGVTTIAATVGSVASVAGRTGAVTLTASDVSSGFGTAVGAALAGGTNVTLSTIAGVTTISATAGGGGVSSVNTRTGAVALTASDITSGLGAAVLATLVAGAGISITGTTTSTITAAMTSVAGRTGAVTLANTDISGLGTAATVNTGTSGGSIPLLNGTNTWAAVQTFTSAPVFTNASGTRTALGLVPGTDVEKFGQRTIGTAVTASRTLALTDLGTFIPCNHATVAIAITVPPNSSVAFPVGAAIDLARDGAADVSAVAGAGVTIKSEAGNLKAALANGVMSLVKTATDTWYLIGNLKA